MTPEPHHPPGAAAATALAALMAPLFQPDVLWTILLAALGAWWSLPPADTATRWQAARTYARMVATASALCWSATWLIRTQWAVPPSVATPVVAFAIAAGGDRWRAVGALAFDALRTLISRRIDNPSTGSNP